MIVVLKSSSHIDTGKRIELEVGSGLVPALLIYYVLKQITNLFPQKMRAIVQFSSSSEPLVGVRRQSLSALHKELIVAENALLVKIK